MPRLLNAPSVAARSIVAAGDGAGAHRFGDRRKQDDEWRRSVGDMTLETLAPLGDDPVVGLSAAVA